MKKALSFLLLSFLALPLSGCVVSPRPHYDRNYYYTDYDRRDSRPRHWYRYRPYDQRHHWDRPRYND